MAHSVFINYRGEDSQLCGVLVHNALVARCGRSGVFLDTSSLLAGDDFEQVILRRLRESSIVLAIIGPYWLTAVDSAGRRCIDSPQDWVRRELSIAFALALRVVPVLTDGARLPSAAELPADIAQLSKRQFMHVRLRHAEEDVARLVDALMAFDLGPDQGGAGPGHAPGVGTAPWGVVNHNEGIQMTGGRMTITGSAIGRGALAGDGTRQRREARVALRALREHIDANAARLADPATVAAALDTIAAELDRHRPREGRLLRLVATVQTALTAAGLATGPAVTLAGRLSDSFDE